MPAERSLSLFAFQRKGVCPTFRGKESVSLFDEMSLSTFLRREGLLEERNLPAFLRRKIYLPSRGKKSIRLLEKEVCPLPREVFS